MVPELLRISDTERMRIYRLVQRHKQSAYRLPISATMSMAIEPVIKWLRSALCKGRPLRLDAGCGTGESTLRIAQQFPEACVIGIDRSSVRIKKCPVLPYNALVCRARLEELWLLSLQAGIVFECTHILYPNPYPKPVRLKSRWYCHPIFPTILSTTRTLELRTNNACYAAGFVYALELMNWSFDVRHIESDNALTPFERKYRLRGETCWRVSAFKADQC